MEGADDNFIPPIIQRPKLLNRPERSKYYIISTWFLNTTLELSSSTHPLAALRFPSSLARYCLCPRLQFSARFVSVKLGFCGWTGGEGERLSWEGKGLREGEGRGVRKGGKGGKGGKGEGRERGGM